MGQVKAKTQGVSPKALWAVVAAIVGYLLTQELVDLPKLVELLITATLVGGAAATASPGLVKPTNPFVADTGEDATALRHAAVLPVLFALTSDGAVSALLTVLVILVIIVAIVWVLRALTGRP